MEEWKGRKRERTLKRKGEEEGERKMGNERSLKRKGEKGVMTRQEVKQERKGERRH